MKLKLYIVALHVCLFGLVNPAGSGNMMLLGTGVVSGGSCSEASVLTGRMNGTQNNAAITTAVCGMVTDGSWAKLDFLYVFAITSGNQLLNWKSTAFSPLTVTGSCTHVPNDNYNCDGSTGYLPTTYTPSTAGGNATLNSTTAGVCETLSFAGGNVGIMMGGADASNAVNVAPSQSGAGGLTGVYDLNDATFPLAVGTNMQGSWILTRNNNTQLNLYLNGSLDASSPMSASSTALVTRPIYISARNNNGTADQFSFARIGYSFYASGMTAGEVSAFRLRLATYMSTVGSSGC